MAREVIKKCDICRKPTEQIVGKLLFVPIIPGVIKFSHSHYSHHADVGVCCKDKFMNLFNFRKRETAAQYRERRRNGK